MNIMKNKFYLLALLASLIILPHTLQAQKKGGEIKKDIAIQLYSVRDRIGSYVGQTGGYQNDYTAILKELAQMIYLCRSRRV